MEKRILTTGERIANNAAIADSYYKAYDKKAVKTGLSMMYGHSRLMQNTGHRISATA